MKVVVIIQARLGSTRLPGKILKKLGDKTVIEHVVERARNIIGVDQVIVATTKSDLDDKLVDFLSEVKIPYYRGSEEDVLSRYFYTALEYNADTIIRITSDCPLLDSDVSSKMLEIYLNNEYKIVSNASSNPVNRTFPRGLDTEIFSFQLLEKAYKNANKKYQREHVTPYLYENEKNIFFYKNKVDYSNHRWTLDTIEDYKMISEVYNFFYKSNKQFKTEEIIKFLNENISIYNINTNIEQKSL